MTTTKKAGKTGKKVTSAARGSKKAGAKSAKAPTKKLALKAPAEKPASKKVAAKKAAAKKAAPRKAPAKKAARKPLAGKLMFGAPGGASAGVLAGMFPGLAMPVPFGNWSRAAVLLPAISPAGSGSSSRWASVASELYAKLPPAVKKPAAKNAAAKKATAKKAAARPQGAAAALGIEVTKQLRLLQGRAQLLRQQRESKPAEDVVMVRTPSRAGAGADVQTLKTDLGRMAAKFAAQGAPRMGVVRELNGGVVLNASPADVGQVRRELPALQIAPVTYAYPQYIRPLGEDLEEAEVLVTPGMPVTKVKVRLRTPGGTPVPDVVIRAFLEWSGAQVKGVTDATGIADITFPSIFPEVCFIQAEPKHSYWSVGASGFPRTAAPAMFDLEIQPIEPDVFGMMANYAPYDATAGQGVKVAVIDSGVGPHVSITVTDGACVVTGENPTDHHDNGIGHGTHVAGTIAAKMSPNGIYGLAPACELYSYRVCPSAGNKEKASSVDIAAALELAIEEECDLVNISMGSLAQQPEVQAMLAKARDNGVVVFAATGNDGQENLRFPAAYPEATAIAALGRDACCPADSPEASRDSEVREGVEFVTAFSNYGTGTDFIGPGLAVLSTFPQNLYAAMSGTSMATPFTTGMAARLLGARADLMNLPRDAARVQTILDELAKTARTFGWDAKYGVFGVLE